MKQYTHATPRKCAAVIALADAKVPYRQIKRLYPVSLGQISYIVKRAKENPQNPTVARVRSGRPSKLSSRGK